MCVCLFVCMTLCRVTYTSSSPLDEAQKHAINGNVTRAANRPKIHFAATSGTTDSSNFGSKARMEWATVKFHSMVLSSFAIIVLKFVIGPARPERDFANH